MAEGNAAETALAFAESYRMFATRIPIFVTLPLASLDRLTLQTRLDGLGGRQVAEAE